MEYLPKTENADVSEWSEMTGERGENGKNKHSCVSQAHQRQHKPEQWSPGWYEEGTVSGKRHRGSFWGAGNVPYPYPDGGYPGEEMES